MKGAVPPAAWIEETKISLSCEGRTARREMPITARTRLVSTALVWILVLFGTLAIIQVLSIKFTAFNFVLLKLDLHPRLLFFQKNRICLEIISRGN